MDRVTAYLTHADTDSYHDHGPCLDLIIFAMLSKPKSIEEIAFSVRLIKTEASTLELFIREYWLAKNLLNNSALSLYLVMYLF